MHIPIASTEYRDDQSYPQQIERDQQQPWKQQQEICINGLSEQDHHHWINENIMAKNNKLTINDTKNENRERKFYLFKIMS